MATLIDSSVLIASERGQFDFSAFLDRHGDEEFALSAITASELLHGVHRASELHRARRAAYVEQLLAELPVVPFDAVAARIHAAVWAELAAKGIAIGSHDLLIAATALSMHASVVSRDQRSFSQIPGLQFHLI